MLSSMLNSVINDLDGDTLTLRQLMEKGGREGLLLICALSCLPFLIPVSIPGVSTVFGAAIILIALAVFFNRLPWFPQRILEKELDAVKLVPALKKGSRLVARIERWLTPRILPLTSAAAQRVNSMGIVFGGILLMAPLGLIPFSNTLPAAAILLLSLGMMQRDGAYILLGYAGLVGTLAYFSFLAKLAWMGGALLVSQPV